MDQKTTGLIATIATLLLCGCPGICMCLFGALSAVGLGTWTTEFGALSDYGTISTGWGIAILCLGLAGMLIPALVGFFTLRNKPEAEQGLDEPLPPAS
jgi:hypothetical protein